MLLIRLTCNVAVLTRQGRFDADKGYHQASGQSGMWTLANRQSKLPILNINLVTSDAFCF